MKTKSSKEIIKLSALFLMVNLSMFKVDAQKTGSTVGDPFEQELDVVVSPSTLSSSNSIAISPDSGGVLKSDLGSTPVNEQRERSPGVFALNIAEDPSPANADADADANANANATNVIDLEVPQSKFRSWVKVNKMYYLIAGILGSGFYSIPLIKEQIILREKLAELQHQRDLALRVTTESPASSSVVSSAELSTPVSSTALEDKSNQEQYILSLENEIKETKFKLQQLEQSQNSTQQFFQDFNEVCQSFDSQNNSLYALNNAMESLLGIKLNNRSQQVQFNVSKTRNESFNCGLRKVCHPSGQGLKCSDQFLCDTRTLTYLVPSSQEVLQYFFSGPGRAIIQDSRFFNGSAVFQLTNDSHLESKVELCGDGVDPESFDDQFNHSFQGDFQLPINGSETKESIFSSVAGFVRNVCDQVKPTNWLQRAASFIPVKNKLMSKLAEATQSLGSFNQSDNSTTTVSPIFIPQDNSSSTFNTTIAAAINGTMNASQIATGTLAALSSVALSQTTVQSTITAFDPTQMLPTNASLVGANTSSLDGQIFDLEQDIDKSLRLWLPQILTLGPLLGYLSCRIYVKCRYENKKLEAQREPFDLGEL
jgi:hypothetical protein